MAWYKCDIFTFLPYAISVTYNSFFFFDFEVAAGYIDNIRKAIAEFEKYTCIKWKPRGKEKYWVRFIKGKG